MAENVAGNVTAPETGSIGNVVKAASNASDPGDGLRAVAALKRLSDDLEVLHVQRARDLGWTWQQIAGALGVTRQTVHRKHQGRAGRPSPRQGDKG